MTNENEVDRGSPAAHHTLSFLLFLLPSFPPALPQAPPSLLGPATLNLLAREEKRLELQPAKRGELLPLYQSLLTMLEKGMLLPSSLPPSLPPSLRPFLP